MLQCGHDPEAVESDQRGRPAGDDRNASMRPRPGGRGERYSTVYGSTVGSFNAATTRRPWRTLAGRTERKCERGFNAATTRRPWRADLAAQKAADAERLQCGHDPEAVENAWRPWRCRQRCGFNAATTRRPWRAGGVCKISGPSPSLQCGHDPEAVESAIAVVSANPASATLQCGHDPEAVENRSVHGCRLSRRSASMRPRPGGRGEPGGRCGGKAGREGQASMRPRPGGRGEPPTATADGLAGRQLQCGHDPEAVEKPSHRNVAIAPVGLSASMRPRPGGRGEPHRSRTGIAPSTASMRPRPGGRGEPQAPALGRTSWKLQCGHDPEAVENRERATAWSARREASMRPRPGGRGEPATRRGGHDPAAASMRPRPGGRGERWNAGTAWRRHWASMRPRPGGRGELQLRTARRTWTSRFNAATTRRPWRDGGPACSHGRRRSFNAATTRRPWRGTAELAKHAPSAELQCGHDPEAVENPRPASDRHQQRRASMRPRPGGRGDRRDRGDSGQRDSFNAATTRRPWRTDSRRNAPARL